MEVNYLSEHFIVKSAATKLRIFEDSLNGHARSPRRERKPLDMPFPTASLLAIHSSALFLAHRPSPGYAYAKAPRRPVLTDGVIPASYYR